MNKNLEDVSFSVQNAIRVSPSDLKLLDALAVARLCIALLDCMQRALHCIALHILAVLIRVKELQRRDSF